MGNGASLMAQMVKNPQTMQMTRVRSLGWKDPLEKEMATHSSIHAWKIPWTEWGRKELDRTERLHFHFSSIWLNGITDFYYVMMFILLDFLVVVSFLCYVY